MVTSIKILVVDDSEIMRNFLKDSLSDSNYEVDTAEDGLEALDKLKSQKYNILLTDLKMPRMDGISLIQELGRTENYQMSVVVMTSHGTLDSARQALQEGVSNYILKPFDYKDLLKIINDTIEKKRIKEEKIKINLFSELFSINEKINLNIEEKNILTMVFQAAVTSTPVDRCFAIIQDVYKENEFSAVSSDDKTENTVNLVKFLRDFRSNNTKLKPVVLKKEYKLTENSTNNYYVSSTKSYIGHDEGINVVIFAPLKAAGRYRGEIVFIKNSQSLPLMSEADIQFLSFLSVQASMSIENSRLFADLNEAYLSAINSLILGMEAKDTYTSGHSDRVTRISIFLGKKLGLSEKELNIIANGAKLHDIGKIGIPEAILNKPGPLSSEEFEIIRKHVVIGFDMIKPIKALKDIRGIVRSHHEREDGKGYPDGLLGKNIPMVVKVVIAADAYDAMHSKRVYRDELPVQKIVSEFISQRGRQFDPLISDIMVKLINSHAMEEILKDGSTTLIRLPAA